jgi:alpha-beta hydrolase superfamily lysophospholipase
MTPVARVPVSLVRARTRDGVWLDGVMVEPRRRRNVALVWVHGLGSAFASGQPLIRALSSRLKAAGVAYVKLNTRGHDRVARADRRLAGAAFERFPESVEDIRAAITLARRAGYSRVVLAGHSTGANKVLHYAARARDRRLIGLILLGPVSDIAAEAKQVGLRELRRRVAVAERIARRDGSALVPHAFGFWSARRYLSLYRPGGIEDVFPYYRPRARWSALRRVRLPVAVIIGGRDEYLDRTAASLIDAFTRNATRARSFTGVAIPRARHGFQGQEDALSGVVVRWVAELAAKRSRSRTARTATESSGVRSGRTSPRTTAPKSSTIAR